jgi:transcriptional regulator with XRE-family HTH domain
MSNSTRRKVTIDGAKIGTRIRNRREDRGLSLNALSEQATVSKGYLSQLENGSASNPSIDTLRRIAVALELPLEELVSEPRPPESGNRRLPRGLAEFVAERELQGNALPDEDVEMLRGIFYRGRQAKTSADWAFLYETIVRTIK